MAKIADHISWHLYLDAQMEYYLVVIGALAVRVLTASEIVVTSKQISSAVALRAMLEPAATISHPI